jgi:hypothetical protein
MPMYQPLFIDTSKGPINLALVTHIYLHAGECTFQFERSVVSLPEKEGKLILAQLRDAFQERLFDYIGGVK